MEKPIIEIKQGKLLGTVGQDMDGNNFYSFRGIPYAKPPLGKLRFRAPLPPLPWQGIFHATKNGNCCYSKDLFKKEMVGSEDCLNLNVYTPTLPSSTNNLLPVMVWIHGGGLLCGSNDSDIYGPEFLITEQVLIVTINYRLGLLGFLSLNDPSTAVPGNAGFKDLVMALTWVNINIAKFNGDPNNVTIFGESAGGVVVHMLMLSPMAKGLFHKAIAQSGCALHSWARAKKTDEDLFKIFGCEGKNDLELLEHLQSLPVEAILQNQAKVPFFVDPSSVNYYGLVIEKTEQEQGETPFMSEEPIDIILSKKYSDVPFIIGYNNLDGLVVDTYKFNRVVPMITNFERNIPHVIGYKVGSDESKILGQKIKQYYFGDEEPNNDNRDLLYKMVTDHSFMYGIVSSVRMHILHMNSPVYFYRMSLTTSLKFLQALMTQDTHKGAAHGDDVAYLFKTRFTPLLAQNSVEYVSIKSFVKLWGNFARYGNPTPDNSEVTWRRATEKKLGFLEIGRELKFNDMFDEKSLHFWDKIYAESPSGYKFANWYSKF